MSRSVVCGPQCGGYAPRMSDLERFITDVELSIVEKVDSLRDDEAALLYAGVLDAEQRLDALRDTLVLLGTR
jgi:hypothetical protein